MGKRIELSRAQIVCYVSKSPGAYLLICRPDKVIYVGRSDTDLQGRQLDHLPENEEKPCIRTHGPQEVYFEHTVDAWAAYRLECEWYQKYRPDCNDVPPNEPSS